MPVLILIDGLTAPGDPPLESWSPPLAGLAAAGACGRIALARDGEHPEDGAGLLRLFGLTSMIRPDFDLPQGFLTALHAGLAPDPGDVWACLGFSHLKRRREDLVFLSPERTGQSPAEIQALTESLRAEFAAEGVDCLPGPGGAPLIRVPDGFSARSAPLGRMEGCSPAPFLSGSADQSRLGRLLTIGQLILARHPVNLERNSQGRLPLNSPWIWGVAPGPAGFAIPGTSCGQCWSADPLVGGMAVAAGWTAIPLDAEETVGADLIQRIVEGAETSGPRLLHLAAPALLGRHGLPEKRLTRLAEISQGILGPLAAALASRDHGLCVCEGYPLNEQGAGTIAPTLWAAARGADLIRSPRFWRRSGWGRGAEITVEAFRTQWMN